MPFPNAPGMIKNILFVAGYMIWDAFYTVANVPYGASTATTVMSQAYFNAAQISGIVSMLGYIGVFLYMPFINQIVRRFGKKESIVAGCCISVLAYILMLILPITPDTRGLILFIVCQLIYSLGAGIGTCLAWSLMADTTDYGEWKFGTREEGTTYSLHSFFRKLGQSVGPSLGLLLATWLGYDAALGASQTIEVATNMRYLVAFMYLLSALIQLVSYGLIYNIDRKTLENMERDLAQRREAVS